ncbi:MAG TPA: single-stranded-DNA-specific exonuclease RecJ [Bacteroidetes bacterium]|nr:single-stranded-DNA-specific exonuclease RecJ [Ignavibacteria bacterium]HCA41880.1 single-stranded-DNA-specific exonuclease RecJ [Bacteroidota bacterium]HCN37973.1 single-stranded-DNA-specific exonuclease RecJ [Bacteroidota bacterium]
MKKNWKLKQINPGEENSEKKLKDELVNTNLPDAAIRLLTNRGVFNYAQLIKFFKPSLENLLDPFILKDSIIASNKLIEVIQSKEKIMILGDYDVDGTCGVSMFYLFLKEFGLEPKIYIPDRITEGYGISNKAINEAHEEGIKLIVSIDCGITAVEQIKYAKELGIEFIICDHHQPPEIIPDAFAILNPLQKDDKYEYKFLCGTGVAFKLIQAICFKLGKTEIPERLIDFVAIASASDIVPITGENRILVREGLELLKKNPRPSFKILMEKSKIKPETLSVNNIVFSIAPRINAAGRLGDAKKVVDLLTSLDIDELENMVTALNKDNESRKELDKVVTDFVYEYCDENNLKEKFNSIILHNDNWHPGIVGIVAARLVERYHVPSIVLTTVNGVAKGSARSINGFNVYEALKRCENLLVKYGGHYYAAGLEIELENIKKFKDAFNELTSEQISEENKIHEIEIDYAINLKDINIYLASMLKHFEPFGPGNPVPIFLSKNVIIDSIPLKLKQDTLKFILSEENSDVKHEAIFFNSKNHADNLRQGMTCDICYEITMNEWKKQKSIQLKIKDIKYERTQ